VAKPAVPEDQITSTFWTRFFPLLLAPSFFTEPRSLSFTSITTSPPSPLSIERGNVGVLWFVVPHSPARTDGTDRAGNLPPVPGLRARQGLERPEGEGRTPSVSPPPPAGRSLGEGWPGEGQGVGEKTQNRMGLRDGGLYKKKEEGPKGIEVM